MIVVTGAAGFIGSALVWRLNTRGMTDIVCVDTPPSAEGNANLAPLRYRAYLQHEDFRTRFRAGKYDNQITAIYHLGACSSTTETNWAYLLSNNVEYSQELCTLSLARGIRFVHASSAATYGDGSRGYSDDHASTPGLEPLNLYGRSKQEFDLWALAEGHFARIAAVKYFNVYGPNEWDKGDMRSMVCKGYEQIVQTGLVKLFKSDRPEYTDGGQMRDFVYVKDAVDMTLWLGEHAEANGIFNVGTGEAVSWNRLIGAIFLALGREPNIEYVDMPAQLKGKYQYFTQAEMAKLRAAGCDVAITPLEDAVRDYVRNHLMTGKRLGA